VNFQQFIILALQARQNLRDKKISLIMIIFGCLEMTFYEHCIIIVRIELMIFSINR